LRLSPKDRKRRRFLESGALYLPQAALAPLSPIWAACIKMIKKTAVTRQRSFLSQKRKAKAHLRFRFLY
jgi:hypothetical protein